jgi:sec-independent protein translocase protein TatC
MTAVQLKNQKRLKIRSKSQSAEPSKTIFEHLDELKARLIWWFLTFIAGSMVGYLLYDQILAFIIKPLSQPLFYSSPVGGFEAVFSIALMFGFMVSIPILLYQTIKFIEPAFEHFPQKLVLISLLASFLLCFIGAALAYYLILPAALQFLGNFGQNQLQALITTNDYFSFVTRYLLGFAFLFQLPLVMLIINKFTPLKPKKLLNYLRHVILISFVIAAILTPTPDFVNQTIMAAPLILLYLVSVGFIWLSEVLAIR